MTGGQKAIVITASVLLLTTAVWGGIKLDEHLKKNAPLNPTVAPDDNSPQFVFGSNPDQFSANVINAAERIYKVESANYTSNIYKQTYSAGMIATSSTTPFGWPSLGPLFASGGSLAPTGTYLSSNGHQYIKFQTLRAGVYTLCKKLTDYEASHYKADYWNNGAAGSTTYLAALNSIQASACFSPTQAGNPLL